MAYAYYNEIDKNAVAWLNELIKGGHIADGVVDDRPIQEIEAWELEGFTQCHFFAGLGGWSYALRLADWPDDQEVWTGSCPCQPFSSSGKRKGFNDDRHVWPYWNPLISERNPSVVFGEQVASPDGLKWFDLVSADLEASGYAVGAADLSAAGVGAPHIRQRLYWVADSDYAGPQGRGRAELSERADELAAGAGGAFGGMADSADQRCLGRGTSEAGNGRDAARVESERLCRVSGMGNSESSNRGLPVHQRGSFQDSSESVGPSEVGFWSYADWLPCTDGKFRPVEPGTFPLAHGAPARVGRLRGYGNAIVPQVAATFIQAYLESR